MKEEREALGNHINDMAHLPLEDKDIIKLLELTLAYKEAVYRVYQCMASETTK